MLKDTKSASLIPFVKERAQRNSIIYSDNCRSYMALGTGGLHAPHASSITPCF